MNDPPKIELSCPKSRYAAARCLLRLVEICQNGNLDHERERTRAVMEVAEALLGPDPDLKKLTRGE